MTSTSRSAREFSSNSSNTLNFGEPFYSSNFLNRATNSHLHHNNSSLQSAIAKEGVSYVVRYIGCLEVNTSMKDLEFEVRSKVAKECIRRVCEAAGLKTATNKSSLRSSSNSISKLLGDHPRMEHAGANVNLTISSGCLVLSALQSGQVIVRHDMPRISFASGGDSDTLDFVAYVAKNLQEWRACYVLECGGGLAQEIIATIGQAFDLRFKQFMTKPPNVMLALSSLRNNSSTSTNNVDRDYYNDLPGKVPPEMGPPPVPPLPNQQKHETSAQALHQHSTNHNLIDLHSPLQSVSHNSTTTSLLQEHNYVNDNAIDTSSSTQSVKDIFDMHPFGHEDTQRAQLWREIWYHGAISRAEAEALLTKDGDFLVRESQGSSGQYVLTGMQHNTKKHLLLIDPEGAVRTKDRMFENVSHLIKYHCENQLPIISAESALVLRTPIARSYSLPTTN